MKDRMDTIALIGMPGCGKTTIGLLLAHKLGYQFVDLDDYIVKHTGCGIGELFLKGEFYFRDIESEMLKEALNGTAEEAIQNESSGMVISTGGGIVTRAANIEKLRAECQVIYIDRPIEEIVTTLDTNSRPLLKDKVNNIYKLYEQRHLLYEKCCTIKVDNHNREPSEVADMILESLNRAKEGMVL